MFKLITLLLATIPVILFLKAAFFDRSKAMRVAAANFRRQVDFLVWLILLLVGCGLVYSAIRLTYSHWS